MVLAEFNQPPCGLGHLEVGMTKKQHYLSLLMNQSPAWIKASMNHPSPRMSRVDIALHKVALKRMGIDWKSP